MDNMITDKVAYLTGASEYEPPPLYKFEFVALLAVGVATTNFYNGKFYFENLPERGNEYFQFEVEPFQKGFLRLRAHGDSMSGRTVVVDLRDVELHEAMKRIRNAAEESYYG